MGVYTSIYIEKEEVMDSMKLADVFYVLFGLFSLYAVYAIASGQWDFSGFIVPVGKAVGAFTSLP